MMTMDPVDKKLDMSLDEIAENRKVQVQSSNSNSNGSGKSKNTKRAERSAQRAPYPSRAISSRRGNDRQTNAANEISVGRRVYVGNLSWSVNAEDLRKHMRSAGKIEEVTIMESNGRSKGCGLVEYSTEGEARYAIRSLHDTEIDGRKIFVREDREAPTASTSTNTTKTTGCRVYVGNLSWTVKWQDLKDHMKQAGNVVYCDVLEESPGRSKGCGLVEYETPQQAEQAIAQLHDTELDGRMIFVREDREPDGGSILSIAKRSANGQGRSGASGSRFQQPQQRVNNGNGEGTSLYIGNLPWDVTWQNLKDVFKSVGPVERAEIPQMADGKSRGFGIVRFVHAKDAQVAIDRFNGAEINGREVEVRYDKGR